MTLVARHFKEKISYIYSMKFKCIKLKVKRKVQNSVPIYKDINVMENFIDKYQSDIELQKDLQKKTEIIILNNS